MSRAARSGVLSCAAWAMLAIAPAFAQPDVAPAPIAQDGEMTLEACLALARVTHENVIIAQQQARSAHEAVEALRATRLPRVDVSLDARYGNLGPRVLDPTGSGTLIQNAADVELYLQASWDVLNPRRKRLIDRAKYVERQAKALGKGMVRDLDQAVATAFADLVRAEGLVAIQEDVAQIDAELLRIARVREDFGDGTVVETVQAEAQAALAQQSLLAAQNATGKARLTLLSAMGLGDDPGVRFAAEEPAVDIEPPPVTECLAAAYGTRDDIQQLQYAFDIAHVDVRLARLGRGITYGLKASAYTLGSTGLSDRNWQIAFTAALPLFDGGSAKSEIKSAEARQIISEAEISMALRNVWHSVTSAHRDWESAREQLVAGRFAEEAGLRSLEQSQAAFAAGESSFFATLQARRQHAQARTQVVEAGAALYHAMWALDRACPDTIDGVNPLSEIGGHNRASIVSPDFTGLGRPTAGSTN